MKNQLPEKTCGKRTRWLTGALSPDTRFCRLIPTSGFAGNYDNEFCREIPTPVLPGNPDSGFAALNVSGGW
jgi:hypothetical protein